MKRVLVLFFVALICMGSIFSDEYTVASYPYYEGTFGTRKTMKIRYDDETDKYMFYVSNSFSTHWMVFTAEDLNTMRKSVEKALEWKDIALKNKAEVSKTIPDSEFMVELVESSSTDFFKGVNKVKVQFAFASTENAALTSLLIVGGTTPSSSNRYIKLEFEGQIILDIQEFADAISEESINAEIKKHNESVSKADSLFI